MLSDKKELTEVIEAILFVAGQGIEIKDIAEKLELKEKVVEEAIANLKANKQNTGVNVITYKGKVQLCSNPKYAEDIATVLNPIKEKQLSKATLETMAVIAYKQPVTRLEIEQVRGVNCDYAVQVLENFKLIEVVGRKDVVGKPLLYATTDEFLKRFELNSIEDLPDYEELLERIKLIHSDTGEEQNGDGLYREFEIPEEEEVPDFLKDEEGLENVFASEETKPQDEPKAE